MDFNTEQFKESVEQIATVMSDLVTAYVQEDGGMGIGDITESCGLARKKRWRILVGDETYKAVRSRKEDTPCATIPHCLKPFEMRSTWV